MKKNSGLIVAKLNGNGWRVYHEATMLAAGPYLRLKRQAIAMMAELYATGADFTLSPKELQNFRTQVRIVWAKWEGLVKRGYDPKTGEYYRK